ncbi:MAG: hypothetical protein LBQ59_00700 [Candidatus Peribacteria bacterium]|jgi:hypothetical protein|nr:hypothetical protein [Candidatus Peribacteria bacterium]
MAELKQKANGIYESVLDQHPEYKGENMQEVRDLAMDLIEQSNLDDSAITEMIFRILT